MTNCTQNSDKTPNPTLEDQIINHILETVNHAIFMFNQHSTSTFYIYCEEQLTTLLPIAKMLKTGVNFVVSEQIENTIDLMQRGEDISEIKLGAA